MKAPWLLTAVLLLAACSNTQSPSSSAPASAAPASAAPSKSATPTPPATIAAAATPYTLPITLIKEQSFTVAAGDYTVEWSLAAGTDTDCRFAMVAHAATGATTVLLIDQTLAGQQAVSGKSDIQLLGQTYSVKQQNYSEAGTTCTRSWSATIKPK